MKHTLIRLAVFTGLSVVIAGCSGTIFKTFDLNKNTSVTTGARQRAIINVSVGPGSKSGRIVPNRIICAEPSPDVAMALANSFGLGVSVLGQGSGSVSASAAEGIAQLAERVSTIQLLRDGLYRACEAYANGAISATEYSMLISGVDDTMVTLLTAELAAGAFGRKLAAIGTEAEAMARADLSQAMKDVNEAADAVKGVEDAQNNVNSQTEIAAKAKTDADTPTRTRFRPQNITPHCLRPLHAFPLAPATGDC